MENIQSKLRISGPFVPLFVSKNLKIAVANFKWFFAT
jgi:hypothetical protein